MSKMSKNKTRTKDKYRVVYNDTQRIELENEFRSSEYITIPRKQEIAQKLQLSERQIKIWFQNRRAKKRKQQKRRSTTSLVTTTTSSTSGIRDGVIRGGSISSSGGSSGVGAGGGCGIVGSGNSWPDFQSISPKSSTTNTTNTSPIIAVGSVHQQHHQQQQILQQQLQHQQQQHNHHHVENQFQFGNDSPIQLPLNIKPPISPTYASSEIEQQTIVSDSLQQSSSVVNPTSTYTNGSYNSEQQLYVNHSNHLQMHDHNSHHHLHHHHHLQQNHQHHLNHNHQQLQQHHHHHHQHQNLQIPNLVGMAGVQSSTSPLYSSSEVGQQANQTATLAADSNATNSTAVNPLQQQPIVGITTNYSNSTYNYEPQMTHHQHYVNQSNHLQTHHHNHQHLQHHNHNHHHLHHQQQQQLQLPNPV